MVVVVCEWGSSTRCGWCALYGDHKGAVDNVRMQAVCRHVPAQGARSEHCRRERLMYCPHCGRLWNRDVHGALAIRLNLLWYLRYGVWHPFYRPPWVMQGKDLDEHGQPNFHQDKPVPLHNVVAATDG